MRDICGDTVTTIFGARMPVRPTNPGTGKARIERSSPSLITEINDLLFRSSSQIVNA
jgi:hypothetical protein